LTRRGRTVATMGTYEPDTAPDAAGWLELEEEERIRRIVSYQRRTKVELPNLQVHAALHAVVENQIAGQKQKKKLKRINFL
jgi:hypothetical protein